MQEAATIATTTAGPTEPENPLPTRRLSPRMGEVIVLLARGMTHDQCAQALGISPSAVKKYLAEAKHRLGVRTRNEAIVAAVAGGLVSLTGVKQA